MAEVQDRHRKAAKKKFPMQEGHEGCDCHDCDSTELKQRTYARALADVEDLNGYDLTACRAAYALVCEAVIPGAGPGGAEAVAMSVELLRRRAERAEAERDQYKAGFEKASNALDAQIRDDAIVEMQRGEARARVKELKKEAETWRACFIEMTKVGRALLDDNDNEEVLPNCPECGLNGAVDNLGDGERLWCGRCAHSWFPSATETK